jgi:hypothetical protein
MPYRECEFRLDTRDFDKKFYRLVNYAVPEYAQKGWARAGAKCIADAIEKEPRAPHDKGFLWRSQKVIAFPAGCILGFNIVYAARHHEAPDNWNWKLTGAGPKYLTSKLAQYRKDYMKIVADTIRNKGL